MSFNNSKTGAVYAPGWFLASEKCTRVTKEIPQSGATTAADGTKYVKAGTLFPSNDGNAIGIVYEDVDVTTGDMPGSVVTEGIVYKDRLPVTPESSAVSALTGITFINTSPSVVRPDWNNGALAEITVASIAGTASGDTKITTSGYTPGAGESYVVKQGATAPTIGYLETPDYSWTPWDGSSDITKTAAKITVVSIDANGRAVAAGSQTITAKP